MYLTDFNMNLDSKLIDCFSEISLDKIKVNEIFINEKEKEKDEEKVKDEDEEEYYTINEIYINTKKEKIYKKNNKNNKKILDRKILDRIIYKNK